MSSPASPSGRRGPPSLLREPAAVRHRRPRPRLESVAWADSNRWVRRSAAESANEVARPGAHGAQELTHLGQPRTELGITHLDRHHRVLELGEDGISFGNGSDGAV